MRKFITALFKIVLPLMYVACVFTGCVATGTIIVEGVKTVKEIGDIFVDIAKAGQASSNQRKNETEAEATTGRKTTLHEKIMGIEFNSFNDQAEDRLLSRRTSTLTGGIPVDVTPYLLHERSFAVTENEIRYCKSIMEIEHKYRMVEYDTNTINIFEFDITVTFEVNNQRYKMDVTAVANAANQSQAKNYVGNYIWKYTAGRFGLNVNDIKQQMIQYNNVRKGKSLFKYKSSNLFFTFVPLFFENIEPCYYQFDVEVAYYKPSNDIKTFDKMYRSELRTIAGAVLDVQGEIWKDANKIGYKNAKQPLPIINFVKAVKFLN